MISDVYDDGRFTYIRIANRIVDYLRYMQMSEETSGYSYQVRRCICHLSYVRDISNYLTLDGVKLEVSRADNATDGES